MTDTMEKQLQAETIRLGDEAVFEQVFRLHYAALCRFASGILSDAENAEEIVQDVFARIWEKRATLSITVSVKSYLFRAVHNGCITFIQKQKKNMRLEEAGLKIMHRSTGETPPIQQQELEQAIGEAIGSLPAQCRRVFELSRFEELKYSEIATALNISVKTVENQMGKALRILRERLSPFLALLLLSWMHHLACLIVLS